MENCRCDSMMRLKVLEARRVDSHRSAGSIYEKMWTYISSGRAGVTILDISMITGLFLV